MMKTRYTAEYVASLSDLPEGDDWDPADVKYTTITGKTAKAVVRDATSRDINGECYNVRREEWREICPGDGISDWIPVASVDPSTLREREA